MEPIGHASLCLEQLREAACGAKPSSLPKSGAAAFLHAMAELEPILGLPLGEISLARLLAQLFAVTEKFNMEAQPQLLLLQKTMLVAEGVGRRLCPDVNMWELARPLIEDWMLEHMGPEARIRDAADSMLDLVERLPFSILEMEESLSRAARHGIRVDPSSLNALAGSRGRGGSSAKIRLPCGGAKTFSTFSQFFNVFKPF